MDELKDMTLEQMNYEITIANLDDAIKYLEECEANLHEMMKEIDELKDYFG